MVGCGGELLRTGRAPVYLTIRSLEASANGGGSRSAFLLSDVQTMVEQTVNGVTRQVAMVFNDNAIVTIAVDAKNPTVETSALNAVTLTRYRVNFRRTDGRNTPGVDVPLGFDGALSLTIPAGSTGEVAFEIVRHQAKLEPPLASMAGFGGLGFLSAIADVTIYGRDQNGNEVQVSGRMDIHFGDFGDEE
jgi:hypothetical protein